MAYEYRENPNCSETHAVFKLVGDSVDPSKMTLVAGVSPSSACRKGETYVVRHSGRSCASKTGVWCISSEDAIESTSIERHLIFLLDLLEPNKDGIKELMEQFSARAEFHIYWVSATGQGGPIISANTAKRIADFNADLDCEFQGPFDEEEDLDSGYVS